MNIDGYKIVQPDRRPADSDLHLSQTTVSNATLCGARVGLRDQEGYRFEPSEAMASGTLIHGMIEHDLRTMKGSAFEVRDW